MKANGGGQKDCTPPQLPQVEQTMTGSAVEQEQCHAMSGQYGCV